LKFSGIKFLMAFYLLNLVVLSGCKEDELVDFYDFADSHQSGISYENIPFNEKGKMMEKFGIGIAEALKKEGFRNLIRNEALKEFNRDHDVLYNTIKYVPFSGAIAASSSEPIMSNARISNAKNLHEFLIPFFESEQELIEFESRLPLLTLFVPTLPEGTFSPELWDTGDPDQIPDVALRLDNIDFVPVIGHDGELFLIEPDITPGWPIVVLKENERLVLSGDPLFEQLDTRIIVGNDGLQYRFISNNFDGSYEYQVLEGSNDIFGASIQNENSPIRKFTRPTFSIPSHLINGWNTWLFFNGDGWQRDHIYYGLTPNLSQNRFVGVNTREHLLYFRLQGSSPSDALRRISNSFNGTFRDPQLLNWVGRNATSPWTDGRFEFRITTLTGQSTLSGGFAAGPNDLFETNVTGARIRRINIFREVLAFRWEVTATKVIVYINPNKG
jgi:hypothetical protein